jgi:tellurite resistance protein TehA-like permease
MATGIISIAAHLPGMPFVAVALFWLNIVTYLVLWFLNVLRIIWFTSQFFSDMVDHKRGPGFFTSIAGSCVLGSQFVLISGNYLPATFLWVLGIILWIGLTYTIFTAFTIKENKPTSGRGHHRRVAACRCLHPGNSCPERPHSLTLDTALQA